MGNLQIRRKQLKDGFIFYEATFLGSNLLAFSLNDLICQLWEIYDFKLSLFQFNLN
jgi:hypothetical protein